MAAVLPQLPRLVGVGRRRTNSGHQERHLTKNLSPGVSPTGTHYERARPFTRDSEEVEENVKSGKQSHKVVAQAAELEIPDVEIVSRESDLNKSNGRVLDRVDASKDPDHISRPSGADRAGQGNEKETILKLSPARLYELTSSPKWLPVRRSTEELDSGVIDGRLGGRERWTVSHPSGGGSPALERAKDRSNSTSVVATPTSVMEENPFVLSSGEKEDSDNVEKLPTSTRTASTPLLRRRLSLSKDTNSSKAHYTSSRRSSKVTPLPSRFDEGKTSSRMSTVEDPEPSPMPQTIPIPPFSLPTYLQLELSSQRPSPLYIHRSVTSDFPYESSRVKIDRLKNFLFLPPQLEQILWFGALACLDCWLYSFTILPLRFLKALSVLFSSWGKSVTQEAHFIAGFIYSGTGRMWTRTRRRGSLNGSATAGDPAAVRDPAMAATGGHAPEKSESDIATQPGRNSRSPKNFIRTHRRTKSIPSALSADHKADILKGLLILVTSVILMYFDASRMYHGIRGQAAIKLYVIYNVLEVCDKLFSAIGQDVLECLFSKEALERKADGRSKVWRPFWLFILALCYNLIHSTALFYQVITLNVAVNSYSNALLTLLMSNQFVEIKSTVFKKFEKENLFQLTCADVVERFQLWLMLMIIASRNIIETGGLSLGSYGGTSGQASASASAHQSSSILPKSFTMFPEWTGQVLGPFILVLGSEMLVDWLKHAYITKFNNTKPAIYGRFLDVLAKDYYSNAFAEPNLTRRLGLPVIPLACLFIRASVQTYHMFVATHMPLPLPSTATSISLESATASPATTAALQHIDQIFRRALGRSTFGAGDPTLAPTATDFWSLDDMIAFVTTAVFFLLLFLVLLAIKLVLGMALLSFARSRYKGMKVREMTSVHAEGRRVGGWGVVEVDEDKRRWIYQDDPAGARRLREKEREIAEKEKRVAKEGGESFSGVSRYSMVAKRIW